MSDDALGVPEHRDTVDRLERGVARGAPPDDLFDRILADVQPSAAVVPLRRRRVPTWAASAAAAALAAAAAVVITLGVTDEDTGLGRRLAQVQVSNARVDGSLAVYSGEDGNRRLVVDLDRVPEAKPGEFYELWISRAGSEVKIPIGSFTAEDGEAHFEVPLPGSGKRLSLDISVEDEGGPPDHSGRTIATARLPTA